MSGHLCLKWNNHSSSFLKCISNIQLKEKFCDATIVCQEKHFPVHKMVLSTCSEYFDELFDRMQGQNPYIVFKDISYKEMEMLLNYMYQGEINVEQELLPSLIKAAEVLRIKGLAVPDDLPSKEDSTSRKKRSGSNNDLPSAKRTDDSRKRSDRSASKSSQDNSDNSTALPSDITNQAHHSSRTSNLEANNDLQVIKDEPLDYISESNGKFEGIFVDGINKEYPPPDDVQEFVKCEEGESSPVPFEGEQKNLEWSSNYGVGESSQNPTPPDMQNTNDDVIEIAHGGNSKYSSEPYPHQSSEIIPLFRSDGNSGNQETLKFHGTRQYSCRYCPYKSKRKGNLSTHIRFKHMGERPFSCNICNARFSMRNGLKLHFQTHTGEKPFKCSHCPKRFIQKIHLKRHIVTHNNQS